MNRKQLSAQKSFTVLILTIVIFSLGILIGNLTTNQKVDTVVELTQQLQVRTLSAEVEYDILRENICTNDEALFLTEDLIQLAERLDFMENELGWDDPRIVDLKEQYFIVEAKHWLLSKQRVEDCLDAPPGLNETIVLYFYSNQGDCPRCQQQGTVISYLHRLYEGMKVYSFDITSETPAVRTIKEVYGVTGEQLPVLIINDEVVPGFSDADEFIAVVRNQQSTASVNNTTSQTTTTLESNSTQTNATEQEPLLQYDASFLE